MPPLADLDRVRHAVAEGCRVMAHRGLAPGILGHISVRVGTDALAVRCRGRAERGLLHTSPEDVRVVTLDGAPARPGELDGWAPPHELPIHTEILRARPDVDCVMHCHPADVVAADLAGLEIRPIVGAYDIPGSAMARAGIARYPRAVLVRSPELGRELAESLGDAPAVVMRGHGLSVVGGSVEETVLRGVSLQEIASLSLRVRSAGGELQDIPDEDVAELPDLGAGLNLAAAWRHELSRLGETRTTASPTR